MSVPFDLTPIPVWLASKRATRVALQFPDSLLGKAFATQAILKDMCVSNNIHVEFFVLADTSESACCVDETAAAHAQVDAIIHFGPTCFSVPSHIETFLVFEQYHTQHIDVIKVANEFANPLLAYLKHRTVPLTVFILTEENLDHAFDRNAFTQALTQIAPSLSFAWLVPPPQILRPGEAQTTTPDIQRVVLGRRVISHEPLSSDFDGLILYLGNRRNGLALSRLAFSFPRAQTWIYDTNELIPATSCHGLPPTRVVSRRLAMIEKASHATVWGILVGTMSVEGYADAINAVSSMITKAGKKSYTFLVGKINPAKLANFSLVVDAFVFISCWNNAVLEGSFGVVSNATSDARKFHRPILSPLELKIALGFTDFARAFGNSFEMGDCIQLDDDDDLSVATGQQPATIANKSSSTTTLTNKPTNEATITLRFSSPAADRLATASFRGLDPSFQDVMPSKAMQGKSGTAWDGV